MNKRSTKKNEKVALRSVEKNNDSNIFKSFQSEDISVKIADLIMKEENYDSGFFKSLNVKDLENRIVDLRARKNNIVIVFDRLIAYGEIWLKVVKSLENGRVKDEKK